MKISVLISNPKHHRVLMLLLSETTVRAFCFTFQGGGFVIGLNILFTFNVRLIVHKQNNEQSRISSNALWTNNQHKHVKKEMPKVDSLVCLVKHIHLKPLCLPLYIERFRVMQMKLILNVANFTCIFNNMYIKVN